MKRVNVDPGKILALFAIRAGVKGEQFREYLQLVAESGDLFNRTGLAEHLPDLCELIEVPGALSLAESQIGKWQEGGISMIVLDSPQYPVLLGAIADPPPVVFILGDPDILSKAPPCIAVVGPRKVDVAGGEIAFRISRALVEAGACLVSGLALGVDGMAHKGALESKAEIPTIAVLGNGLDTVYPTSHERLASQIIDCGGALISQFEPGTLPYPVNFLNRNRIIAGLSLGVLVIQAPARSGSLVTARYALEEGRDVMAIPGAFGDRRFAGAHKLIRDGAVLISCTEDIWDLIPQLRTATTAATGPCKANCGDLSGDQQQILSLLRENGTVHHDELPAENGPGQLAESLLALELDGLIQRLPGNYVTLST